MTNLIKFYKNFKQDKLVFKFNNHKWTETHNLELLHFIMKQEMLNNKKFILTKSLQTELFLFFDKKFTRKWIRQKCRAWGVRNIEI